MLAPVRRSPSQSTPARYRHALCRPGRPQCGEADRRARRPYDREGSRAGPCRVWLRHGDLSLAVRISALSRWHVAVARVRHRARSRIATARADTLPATERVPLSRAIIAAALLVF